MSTTAAPPVVSNPGIHQPRYTKEIRYDRETRDFRATLDGNLVGYYRTSHDAEVALDQLILELLAHVPVCDHELTGRSVQANGNDVQVVCAACGRELDRIACDTPAQARLTALIYQRDPGCPF